MNTNTMAATTRVLERRLQLVEDRRLRVLEASQRTPQPPQQQELWWPSMLLLFGSEQEIFVRNGIDKRVFDEALSAVIEVPLKRRGRKSKINSPRERLLFVLIYIARGVEVLEVLVVRFIKRRDYVHHLAQKIAKDYHAPLIRTFVRFNDEEIDDFPEARLIVDCTVFKRDARNSHLKKRKFSSVASTTYARSRRMCASMSALGRPPSSQAHTRGASTTLSFSVATLTD